MLMSGPPGSGKTLIVRSMPGILPLLSIQEAPDVTRIYSVADLLSADEPLIRLRPFRSPHQTVGYAGLIPAPCSCQAQVGGGRWPKPGERSDWSPVPSGKRGVLFLDELPEFGTRMLEMLRQPLDPAGKLVSISRSTGATSMAKLAIVFRN